MINNYTLSYNHLHQLTLNLLYKSGQIADGSCSEVTLLYIV